MSRLSQVLAKSFSLMVSLPGNRPELAVAAVEAGAHSIKVHLNCYHHASQITYGSWAQERSVLKEILAAVKVPVGLVSGEAEQPSPEDWQEILAAGFDFWDLFAKFAPPRYLSLPLGRMVAVDSSWTPELVAELAALGVQVIEGSVIPKTEYGTPLNLVDLATYARLAWACSMPVLIPSQKALLPEDIPMLRRTGVAGVTIGAIVTGLDVGTLRSATEAFAQACAR